MSDHDVFVECEIDNVGALGIKNSILTHCIYSGWAISGSGQSRLQLCHARGRVDPGAFAVS